VDITESLYKHLTTYAGLTALISTRAYPDTLPSTPTYPAITFQQISEEELDTFAQPLTLIGVTYQINAWDTTRKGAQTLAKQIRLAFKNFKGVMGGTGGVVVSGVEKVSNMSDFYRDSDGKTLAFTQVMDFQIWYQEV